MNSIANNDYAFDDGKHIWFVGRDNHILFKMGKDNRTYEAIGFLGGPDFYLPNPLFRLSYCCYKFKNWVVVLPDRNNKIIVFNLQTGDIYREIVLDYSTRLAMTCYAVFEDKMWIVFGNMNKIAVLDLEEFVITKTFPAFEKDDILPGYEIVATNNTLYIPSKNANMIAVFDTKTYKSNITNIPLDEKGIATMCRWQQWIILTSNKGEIYVIDELNDWNVDFRIVGIDEVTGDENVPLFHRSFVLENKVWFIPLNSPGRPCSQLLSIDLISKEKQHLYLAEKKQESLNALYTLEYVNDTSFVIQSSNENDLLLISNAGKVKRIPWFVKNEFAEAIIARDDELNRRRVWRLFDNKIKKEIIITETNQEDIKKFVGAIVHLQ